MARTAKEIIGDQPDVNDLDELMRKVDSETEWESVTEAAPIKVILDTIGDRFIGDFQGELHVPAEMNISKDKPEGEAFDMYLFRGMDGKLYSVNKSAKLELALNGSVPMGARCRLTYVADIETGRKLNPMKDITVDIARR